MIFEGDGFEGVGGWLTLIVRQKFLKLDLIFRLDWLFGVQNSSINSNFFKLTSSVVLEFIQVDGLIL